jgi:hypothetical protein
MDNAQKNTVTDYDAPSSELLDFIYFSCIL